VWAGRAKSARPAISLRRSEKGERNEHERKEHDPLRTDRRPRREKKARVEPLIAELRTLPPFPDDAVSLAACKPTIGDMRRNATRLRAGKLRPRDPDADPIDVAGRLEKGARWLEVLEALAVEFLDTAARLQVLIDSAEAEVYDACVTTSSTPNNSPRSPAARWGHGSRPWSTRCGGRRAGVTEGRRRRKKAKGEW